MGNRDINIQFKTTSELRGIKELQAELDLLREKAKSAYNESNGKDTPKSIHYEKQLEEFTESLQQQGIYVNEYTDQLYKFDDALNKIGMDMSKTSSLSDKQKQDLHDLSSGTKDLTSSMEMRTQVEKAIIERAVVANQNLNNTTVATRRAARGNSTLGSASVQAGRALLGFTEGLNAAKMGINAIATSVPQIASAFGAGGPIVIALGAASGAFIGLYDSVAKADKAAKAMAEAKFKSLSESVGELANNTKALHIAEIARGTNNPMTKINNEISESINAYSESAKSLIIINDEIAQSESDIALAVIDSRMKAINRNDAFTPDEKNLEKNQILLEKEQLKAAALERQLKAKIELLKIDEEEVKKSAELSKEALNRHLTDKGKWGEMDSDSVFAARAYAAENALKTSKEVYENSITSVWSTLGNLMIGNRQAAVDDGVSEARAKAEYKKALIKAKEIKEEGMRRSKFSESYGVDSVDKVEEKTDGLKKQNAEMQLKADKLEQQRLSAEFQAKTALIIIEKQTHDLALDNAKQAQDAEEKKIKEAEYKRLEDTKKEESKQNANQLKSTIVKTEGRITPLIAKAQDAVANTRQDGNIDSDEQTQLSTLLQEIKNSSEVSTKNGRAMIVYIEKLINIQNETNKDLLSIDREIKRLDAKYKELERRQKYNP